MKKALLKQEAPFLHVLRFWPGYFRPDQAGPLAVPKSDPQPFIKLSMKILKEILSLIGLNQESSTGAFLACHTLPLILFSISCSPLRSI